MCGIFIWKKTRSKIFIVLEEVKKGHKKRMPFFVLKTIRQLIWQKRRGFVRGFGFGAFVGWALCAHECAASKML